MPSSAFLIGKNHAGVSFNSLATKMKNDARWLSLSKSGKWMTTSSDAKDSKQPTSENIEKIDDTTMTAEDRAEIDAWSRRISESFKKFLENSTLEKYDSFISVSPTSMLIDGSIYLFLSVSWLTEQRSYRSTLLMTLNLWTR